MGDAKNELIADFQQYYGLRLEDLWDSCDFAYMRILTEQLPATSRTRARLNPQNAWSTADYLLALAVDNLAFARYENAGAKGQKPHKVPRPEAPKPQPVFDVSASDVRSLLFDERK